MNMIRSLREARGLTQAQLAALVATSQPQIRRLEAGERQLSKEWAQRLAPHLGVDPSRLMFGDALTPASPADLAVGSTPDTASSHSASDIENIRADVLADKPTAAKTLQVAPGIDLQSNGNGTELRAEPFPANARLGHTLPDPSARIPVYGQAVGGIDGEFVMNGDRLEDVFTPPSLSAVAESYAVYVAGESMEPRYFDGEIVYVNPMKRVRRGDFVVAQIQAEEHGPKMAYVKRFVRWNAQVLVLSQYNPEKELHFAAGQVVSVHLVIMGGVV